MKVPQEGRCGGQGFAKVWMPGVVCHLINTVKRLFFFVVCCFDGDETSSIYPFSLTVISRGVGLQELLKSIQMSSAKHGVRQAIGQGSVKLHGKKTTKKCKIAIINTRKK